MRTHYENLKVSETAPDEVIRAAYRALSQIYHPDKNPGDANADRIMQIINAAYVTLSDPLRRQDYNDSLVEQRSAQQSPVSAQPPCPTDSHYEPFEPPKSNSGD